MDYKTRLKIERWKQGPYITYIILAITGFMYVIQEILGGSTNQFVLVRLGAKVNEFIVLGDWFRLITPMFLHIGLTHILFNALIIYFLGIQLESIFGHWRFFLLYFLSGIVGNATSFAFNPSISAGASTAIFGLFGSTLVLVKLFPGQPQIKAMAKNFTLLIILNLVFGIFSSGIDMAGHIGGLIGGYLAAFALSTPIAWRTDKKQQLMYGALLLVVLIILIVLGYNNLISLVNLFS
ncbi:rhomboid family intramembrane serine protease [Alkalibacterium kapii]|uniref:Rhomboid family intramembrane serine protease n=1 Tax=Alkalibacterium kapii TaxID=426704 RepID=A0A511AR15_9LACT|nr:rhomboid family intramembrane serine protease [Alkalibacterium kapii]GEK90640.1 rhomboid family intramembrane serine protease [Alkalibacterium kapii]